MCIAKYLNDQLSTDKGAAMSTHLIPVEIQWLRGGMNETLRQSPATNCTQWSEGVWHCGTQPHDRRCIKAVYVNHTNKQLCQRHQLVCTEPQWLQQLSKSHVTPTPTQLPQLHSRILHHICNCGRHMLPVYKF